MSEDRLEKALEAMRNESISHEELAAARSRVWERLGAPASAACAEFQPRIKDYIEGRLAANQQLLMEDHLGRCADCRRELSTAKGEREVVAMPRRRTAGWLRWRAWAVAAAMVLLAVYAGRNQLDRWLAPRGARATVAMVSGHLYSVPDGELAQGAAIAEGQVLRTAPGSRAILRLADGSAVEVNERSELFVRAAWSGETVYLERGDVIVQAAKQRRGHLRVQTRDSVASVKGTVFAVSSGIGGSVVSVLEGSVEVTQPGAERLLKAGEQASSNPTMQGVSIQQAVAWSPDAEKYLALLADFSALEKKIAAIPTTLRNQSSLLRYMPANAVVYGAAPNLSGTIRQAVALAEQQAGESLVFKEWWESASGKELRTLLEHMQAVTPLLGDEIVFALAMPAPGGKEQIPMLIAEVQPGKQAALAAAIQSMHTGDTSTGPAFVTEPLMVVSDSTAHVQWAVAHLGQGAGSPLAAEIARKYQNGVGWLLSVDIASMRPTTPMEPALEATGAGQMKHLFVEMRNVQGADENSVTLKFDGARTGVASWLASSGSSGAAAYISSEAIFALAASTREPRQLFQELTAQLARGDAQFQTSMQEAEAKLGVSFANDIAGALGTDFAFAVERPTLPIPGWVAIALAYNPSSLDRTIKALVDTVNSSLAAESQPARLSLTQGQQDGRVWNTLKVNAPVPIEVNWTYDRGYLVASNDRALAQRAIATRDGGFQLIWSPAFRAQLPASAGVNPSAFGWLNAGSMLQAVASVVSSPALQKLASERDPVLIVFNGETEQIRAVSRTRLTNLLLDMAMIQQAQGRNAGKVTTQSRHDSASH